MSDAVLQPPVIRMPTLATGSWLNTPQPLTRHDFAGRVVLVDFFDYSCVNCLRTLPYVVAWHGRYAPAGLLVLGIHAPEFRFGRARAQIAAAAEALDLTYPILLDNAFENWQRFAVKAWPTKFLIDHRGYIRWQSSGEGRYAALEHALQALLRARDPGVALPDVLPALRPEDAPGAVCYRPTAEIHAGYRGGLFTGTLGNAEGYLPDQSLAYVRPPAPQRRPGRFYLSGFWRAEAELVTFAGRDTGQVLAPYEALGANAVLSPTNDDVELRLNLRPTQDAPLVEVFQDGRWLTPDIAGADVAFDAEGRSQVIVERPRLYELVRNLAFGRHEVELRFHATGLSLYALTFTTCVAGPAVGDSTIVIP